MWSNLALGASPLLALALLAPPAQGGMIIRPPESQQASPGRPAQSPKPVIPQAGPKLPANSSPANPKAVKTLQPPAGQLPPGAPPSGLVTPKEATIPSNLAPQFVKGVKDGEPLSTFVRIGPVEEGKEVGGGSGLYEQKELGGVSSKQDAGPAPSVPAEDNKSMLNEMHPGVKSGYVFEMPRVDENGDPLPPPGQSWPVNEGGVKYKDERASINPDATLPPPTHVPPAKKDDD